MRMRKKVTWGVVLTVLFSVLAVGGMEAKCRSSKKNKEMASMGCCKMKGMDMGDSREDKADRGSHGDMQMEGMDCCMMMDMKGDRQNMPGMEGGGEKSPTAGQIIQSQRVKDLAIVLSNNRGQLTTGQNSFCVEFRKVETGEMTDAGNVQVDFTMPDMGAMRAVAKVTQSEVGRYCGHVTLAMDGAWSVGVRYDGPYGLGKTVYKVTVK